VAANTIILNRALTKLCKSVGDGRSLPRQCLANASVT
jgi:hypothetical protein